MEKNSNEALIKEILEANKETITEALKGEIKKQIIDNLTWKLRDEVGKIAGEFVENEMKEEISSF